MSRTREELEKIVSRKDVNPAFKAVAQAELQKLDLQTQAGDGDELAQALLAVKEAMDTFKRTNTGGGGGGDISREEVERMLKEALKSSKIKLSDLDAPLKQQILGSTSTQLYIIAPERRDGKARSWFDRGTNSTTVVPETIIRLYCSK